MTDQARDIDRVERELAEVTRQQAATVEVLQVIGDSRFDLGRVFDTVIRNAVTLCRADAGQVWRLDGDGYRIARTFGGPDEYNEYLTSVTLPPAKDTVVGKVALEQHPIQLPDVLADSDYWFPVGQKLGGFRTVLGVPMTNAGVVSGVIITWRRRIDPFDDPQVELLQTFAAHGTIAIASAELFAELEELNRTLAERVQEQVEDLERVGRLKRFLSPQVAELVISEGEASLLETHRSEITAVFCDLRGFTAFSETVEPEEVIGVLREYYEVVARVNSQFEATLDHIAGDGILLYFNDPVPCPDPPLKAVRMALALREEVGRLAAAWRRRGHDLDVGIGVARGHATLGSIGAEGLFHYASIGAVTNLAARLSDEAAGGQILVAARVHAAIEETFECEPVGALTLKGFARPMEAFSVVGVRPSDPA